uniref:Uncharacterized protein n=1 Tax=Rhizochromulina marina TaxID=1034831 RepID=A0A7S2W1D2_9STRA
MCLCFLGGAIHPSLLGTAHDKPRSSRPRRNMRWAVAVGALVALSGGRQEGLLVEGAECGVCDQTLVMNITFDDYPEETTWTLEEDSRSNITGCAATNSKSGGPYAFAVPNRQVVTVSETICAFQSYNFTLMDAFGDGICCQWGNGRMDLELGGTVVASLRGSANFSSLVFPFTALAAPTVAPTDAPTLSPTTSAPSVSVLPSPQPSPQPTGCPCDRSLRVNFTFDDYPKEVTWSAQTAGPAVWDCEASLDSTGGPYDDAISFASDLITTTLCPGQVYNFTVFDDFNDGICCTYGDGSYTLYLDGVELFTSDGIYTTEETTTFTVPFTSAPSVSLSPSPAPSLTPSPTTPQPSPQPTVTPRPTPQPSPRPTPTTPFPTAMPTLKPTRKSKEQGFQSASLIVSLIVSIIIGLIVFFACYSYHMIFSDSAKFEALRDTKNERLMTDDPGVFEDDEEGLAQQKGILGEGEAAAAEEEQALEMQQVGAGLLSPEASAKKALLSSSSDSAENTVQGQGESI